MMGRHQVSKVGFLVCTTTIQTFLVQTRQQGQRASSIDGLRDVFQTVIPSGLDLQEHDGVIQSAHACAHFEGIRDNQMY